MLVRHRTHNRADGQAVKIVIHENQHSEKHGCKQRALLRADRVGRPLTISLRRTRLCDQCYHDAEKCQEKQNVDIAPDLLAHDRDHCFHRMKRIWTRK